MPTSKIRAAAGAALLAFLAGAAVAAGLSGQQAAMDRHEHMKALGAAAKALGEQMQSAAPDPAAVKLQADRIAVAGQNLTTWFPAGSGQQAWPKSRALPLIWSDPAGFAAAARQFTDASTRLAAAADAGDLAGAGAQMKPVGGACKGCHDKFRAPEK